MSMPDSPARLETDYGRSASADRGSTGGATDHRQRFEKPAFFGRGAEQLRDITHDHEGQAVLLAMAAGFGVGLLLGIALGPRAKRTKWSPWGERAAAEGLGRRLLDRVDRILPDAVSEKICT